MRTSLVRFPSGGLSSRWCYARVFRQRLSNNPVARHEQPMLFYGVEIFAGLKCVRYEVRLLSGDPYKLNTTASKVPHRRRKPILAVRDTLFENSTITEKS